VPARRSVRCLAAGACVVAAVASAATAPSASADDCVVTVTLISNGGALLTLNVPPGTPLSDVSGLAIPGLARVSEACPGTSTTPTSQTTPTATTTAPSPRAGRRHRGTVSGRVRAPSSHRKERSRQHKASPKTSVSESGGRQTVAARRSSDGVPTAFDPTVSYALPGPTPIGVPNFFINAFQIPPFLLPIYWAAGIEYEVPWQVLAAINEIETDYGRNLSVSSAGAVGWMQFLPSTWQQYAVDATGSGIADPYNPVDAIFTAARYLQAAGAATNLPDAIYSYNHAGWYVQSVLLRAKLIGGMPSRFIGTLAGLVSGQFPVDAPATYADDYAEWSSTSQSGGSPAANVTESQPSEKGIAIYARQGSPVVAVNDGRVIAMGRDANLGRYLELRDADGNVFTYADLGSVATTYAVPRAVLSASDIVRTLARAPKPTRPATAGKQQPPTRATPAASSLERVQVKERLFAFPSRPASYAAGGKLQLVNRLPTVPAIQVARDRNQSSLEPLKPGTTVTAGAVLGWIGPGSAARGSHLEFLIRPAGRHSPYIDPKPILDGWKLLEATAAYRAAGLNPFVGEQALIGRTLSLSTTELERRVLGDAHVRLSACGRRDIRSGEVDRRVLAAVAVLATAGLDPTISGAICRARSAAVGNADSAGWGTIANVTVLRVLAVVGVIEPDQPMSASEQGHPKALAMPGELAPIEVSYSPRLAAPTSSFGRLAAVLKPDQWMRLINRIDQLPEPLVPVVPSQYAIRTG
jgi:murein DD-endopeptidase MepM/ murein hydrolase activator NlpD